jgi:hypothetical protein
MSKETLRKAIAKHIKDYLDKGGVIEQVPRVTFCPAYMGWARKRGMDWTPWSRHGDFDFFSGQDFLGDGCYMTKPKATEE